MLDVLTRAVQRLTNRRLHRRERHDRWMADHRCCSWKAINSVERQDRSVFIVEDAVVVRGMARGRMHGQVPVNEQVLVPVILGFVDVFRRSLRKARDGGHEREPD